MVSTGTSYFQAVLNLLSMFSIVPSVRCGNSTSEYDTARVLQAPRPLMMKAVCSFEMLGIGNTAVECNYPDLNCELQ